MNIPDHLRYTLFHLWVATQDDGTVLAGITDHAQETLGDIVYVDAPAVGKHIEAGQPCGIVESVKTASDLHAPVSGTIVEINPELQDTPEKINESPYSAWIFRVQPDASGNPASLLDAASYRALLE
jgi:glycine cleavage system H protein